MLRPEDDALIGVITVKDVNTKTGSLVKVGGDLVEGRLFVPPRAHLLCGRNAQDHRLTGLWAVGAYLRTVFDLSCPWFFISFSCFVAVAAPCLKMHHEHAGTTLPACLTALPTPQPHLGTTSPLSQDIMTSPPIALHVTNKVEHAAATMLKVLGWEWCGG